MWEVDYIDYIGLFQWSREVAVGRGLYKKSGVSDVARDVFGRPDWSPATYRDHLFLLGKSRWYNFLSSVGSDAVLTVFSRFKFTVESTARCPLPIFGVQVSWWVEVFLEKKKQYVID